MELALIVGLRVPRYRLPHPHSDKVVVELFHPIQAGRKVESGRRVRWTDVNKVGPCMRAGQIDGPAALVCKITRILLQNLTEVASRYNCRQFAVPWVL